jgi:hypothetical protein
MGKKLNGYIKWIAAILTILMILGILFGVVWNAATLSNDVKHLKEDVKEIKMYLFEKGQK